MWTAVIRSRYMRSVALSACIATSLLWSGLATAQTPAPAAPAAPANASSPAGQVEFLRGVGFAQAPGQAPRTLGQGLPVAEGDRLTTSEGAFAILKLQDGTRMTIRPNTEIVLQQYKFAENSPTNSMVMQLLRGGLRTLTGLISKNAPNAARIQTNTATVGIRGTDFDARICGADCRAESTRVAAPPKPNAILASAKVIMAQGNVNAVDTAGVRRLLVVGGAVYGGESIETDATSKAIIAFRDESRVTIGSNSNFRVDNFAFDPKNPTEGRFFVSLLRGSMRFLTGAIGHANNRNVAYSTSTATVGIRGSEGIVSIPESPGGAIQDALTSYFGVAGAIEVLPRNSNTPIVLLAGQGVNVSQNGAILTFTLPPTVDLPAPESVQIDIKALFAVGDVPTDDDALFIYVRDGHVQITTVSEILHLGRGETGLAEIGGRTGRPSDVPKFIEFDLTPLPDSRNPLLASIFAEERLNSDNQCR